MLFILVILALALFFYYFLWKPQLYWRRLNVKQGPPVPLLGDNLKLVFKQESKIEMVWNIYNRFKDSRYCGLYQSTIPTLMLRDPDLIKQITVKDFDHFVDHYNFTTDEGDPLWSRSLLFLTGDAWKKMRVTLNPTFTASKLRSMFKLMEKTAQQHVDFYLKQNKDVIELEFEESFHKVTTDVIANCVFGIQVDSLKDPKNEFFIHGKEIMDFSGFWKSSKQMLMAIAPRIMKHFNVTMYEPYNAAFFQSLVRDTIKLREEQNIVRPDMIHLLMQARKGNLSHEESAEEKDAEFATVEKSHPGKSQQVQKTEMTETDIVSQAIMFYIAGVETSSTTSSYMCYELALNSDIQERLRQEVDETYKANDGILSYDVLNKMKYLDMVISETLRKHPVGHTIEVQCTKPYIIQPEKPDESPVHLQPGDLIWIPIAGLHRDEKFFPNPDKFDPERFSDENKGSIVPYTYIPFGSGPRICIGARFALTEMKTLMFHILTNFEIIVLDKTPIPIKYARSSLGSTIAGGFWLGMKRRANPVAD